MGEGQNKIQDLAGNWCCHLDAHSWNWSTAEHALLLPGVWIQGHKPQLSWGICLYSATGEMHLHCWLIGHCWKVDTNHTFLSWWRVRVPPCPLLVYEVAQAASRTGSPHILPSRELAVGTQKCIRAQVTVWRIPKLWLAFRLRHKPWLSGAPEHSFQNHLRYKHTLCICQVSLTILLPSVDCY